MIEDSIEDGQFHRDLYLFLLFLLSFRDFAKIWLKKASKTDNFYEISVFFLYFAFAFVIFPRYNWKKHRKRIILTKISIFFLYFALLSVILPRYNRKMHRKRIISRILQYILVILPYFSWFIRNMIEKSIENG